VNGPRLTTAAAPPPRRRAGAAEGAAVSAWWLGQAGFLIEGGGVRLVVDAYLSDSLAAKYRGKPFPHLRMMPPPIEPGDLREVDLVLATHGHTDHLDPGTIGQMAAANPGCRFVVPAAHADLAVSRGVPPDRLVPAHALSSLEVAGARLRALPSAHEELAVDAAGEHLYLGYLVELAGVRLYHSGDCVPYPDLPGHLAAWPPDLLLLPVNGRDPRRAAGGVPGNFTLLEAMALAQAVRPAAVIGHHFGMFEFNTIDPGAARAALAAQPGLPPFLLAEVGVRYDLRPRVGGAAAGGEAPGP